MLSDSISMQGIYNLFFSFFVCKFVHRDNSLSLNYIRAYDAAVIWIGPLKCHKLLSYFLLPKIGQQIELFS